MKVVSKDRQKSYVCYYILYSAICARIILKTQKNWIICQT